MDKSLQKATQYSTDFIKTEGTSQKDIAPSVREIGEAVD